MAHELASHGAVPRAIVAEPGGEIQRSPPARSPGANRLPVPLARGAAEALRAADREPQCLIGTSRGTLVKISQPPSVTRIVSLVPTTKRFGIRQEKGVWNVIPGSSSR